MRLSSRLKAIAEFVSDGEKIIDIGCDHALLDIYLYQNRKKVKIIASDIHEGALKQAEKNIKKYEVYRNLKEELTNICCRVSTKSTLSRKQVFDLFKLMHEWLFHRLFKKCEKA